MKIVTYMGDIVGSNATKGQIHFVVPDGAASSLSRVFFASVDLSRAQEFVLSHEWNFETPKEND